jgi:UPF0755 protein
VSERPDILPPGYSGRPPRPQPREEPEEYQEYDHYDDGYDQDDYDDDYDDYDDYDEPGDDEHRPRSHARPSGRSRPPRGERRGHPLLIAAVVVLVVILIVVLGGYAYINSQINPGGKRGAAVAVSIPSGSSASHIGSILAKAGVIHDSSLFGLYVRINSDGPLYPGSYTLDKNLSYKAAIAALEHGPTIVTDKLVVPPGYTVRQIAATLAALPGLHFSAQSFLNLASSGQVRSPYEPAGVNNLEGLLFPATYDVSQNDTAEDVLEEMIGAFDSNAQQLGLTAGASHLGMTTYQVITVASIVEREAKLDSDRGPVASVIYNRLRASMPLGADSTETYYLRLTDPTLVPSAAQLNQPSSYNTRLNTGLPPTPIASPGVPSLQAAISPPTTDYLYFVEINPDGQLGYASTNAGFEQLETECQQANLC